MAAIETPDGEIFWISTIGRTVFITDKTGATVTFSADLIPEVRAILFDLERCHADTQVAA